MITKLSHAFVESGNVEQVVVVATSLFQLHVLQILVILDIHASILKHRLMANTTHAQVQECFFSIILIRSTIIAKFS